MLQNNFSFSDVLLLARRFIHEGTPLDTVGTAVIEDIGLRSDEVNNLSEHQREWLCRLVKIGIVI